MNSLDKKQQKLQEKMNRIQEQLKELEAAKKASELTKQTPWVANLVESIQNSINEHGKNTKDGLMRVLVQEFGAGSSGRVRNFSKNPVAIKYQDPVHEQNTWTGRGLEPLWLKRYLAAGRSKTEFLVTH